MEGNVDQLCFACQQIDLRALFRSGDFADHDDKLDSPTHTVETLRAQTHCPLCRLFLWVIDQTRDNDLTAVFSDLLPSDVVLLTPTSLPECPSQYGLRLEVWRDSEGVDWSRLSAPYMLLPVASGWVPSENIFPAMARQAGGTMFDWDYAKSWLEQCDNTHGYRCESLVREGGFVGIRFRVIDVDRECLILAPDNCSYTALSYVWGNVQQPLLKTTCLDGWHIPGAFRHIPLPRTIQDAMEVCRKLGLKYLWVDSLCIVQDLPDTVAGQVAHMDSIYSKAYLTIIAASGEDCQEGIPSVRARTPIQKSAWVSDLNIATVFLNGNRELINSKWNSRAWTLQEYVLSRRCMVLTERHVFFSCGEGLRQEDILGIRPEFARIDPSPAALPVIRRSLLSNKPDDIIMRDLYEQLTRAYALRFTTYQSDIINAFTGVTGALEPYLGRFLFGIPEDFFYFGLCWVFNASCRRRSLFPSWSWAGWDFTGNSASVNMFGYRYGLEDHHLGWVHTHNKYFNGGPASRVWRSGRFSMTINGAPNHHKALYGLLGQESRKEDLGLNDDQKAHLIAFVTYFALVDVARQPNLRPTVESSKHILFIIIVAAAPDVMILPVEKRGAVFERIGNPESMNEIEWFAMNPWVDWVYLV
ncbi:heterokaryon incompatibility protein-domain-containing protein [Podospora didyma]|uniref:Heterokaryon incompatibility protein-domain-containing protein n=1 Tax=Podospora didyma TaxID=330526 RepID=A0AAE0K2R1_9PEZI|nr:heterokaryon incompatibility protein-domain-containing protein [Podospora didyma]